MMFEANSPAVENPAPACSWTDIIAVDPSSSGPGSRWRCDG